MKLRSRHFPTRLVTGSLTSVFVVTGLAPAMAVDQDKKRQWPPNPKRKYWDEALPSKAYMHAYRATVQMEARAKSAAGEAALAPWTRSGPIGNFPERDYNGRMGAIFLREHALGYDVYAGASSGGLWWARGTTGVPQWTSIGDDLPNPAVHAINIDPRNYDNIFVGTGDYPRYGGGGMFKTTDGGQTWAEVNLPVAPDAFFEILRSTAAENALWACSSQGILRSLDWGSTWTVMEDGFCTDMAMDPTSSLVQYAVFRDKGVELADNGVYKTNDGWVTSTRILDPDLPTGALFDRASIAVCDGAEETLALLLETNGDIGGIFKSADYGENWTRISPVWTMGGFGQISHAQAIAIRPATRTTFMWARSPCGGPRMAALPGPNRVPLAMPISPSYTSIR